MEQILAVLDLRTVCPVNVNENQSVTGIATEIETVRQRTVSLQADLVQITCRRQVNYQDIFTQDLMGLDQVFLTLDCHFMGTGLALIPPP